MPATINPIRKALLKQAILKNKGNIKASMIEAGYAPSTAQRTSGNKSVKIIQEEINEDIKKKITVESVLNNLNYIQKLAIENDDFGTATRCEELKGKWLAMFTDKSQVSADITNKEEQSVLDKYLHTNRLQSIN